MFTLSYYLTRVYLVGTVVSMENNGSVPMAKEFLYTDHFGLRISRRLRQRLRDLKARGADAPAIAREGIERAVQEAEEKLGPSSSQVQAG